ncbi:MAG TPA: aminomethyltransferase beta-barrel domain-containing protein, partial [Ktedonobacterales bacterium]|nr:aminomethyltransferase beta-barrel domain-containing protein [Ktedonobacterales bacterium]
PIVDERGSQVGEHGGLAYYTVGQRKGLGIAAREPLHVLRLDADRNALVVGPAVRLERDTFEVHETTFTSGSVPKGPFAAQVKVRYKAPAVPATVTPLPDRHARVELAAPQRAITPGQAAVFYGGEAGDEVLGGGLIVA